MRRFWFWSGSLSLLGLLAACGVTPANQPPRQSDGFVLTVSVGADETQESVVQQYGGQAISWHPEAGFAILKLSTEEKAKLSGEISIQAVENSSIAAPEVSAAGAPAWGGGLSAWGGGIGAWASHWSSWGGGITSLPVLPGENRLAWTQIKLPQGQAMAKNFGLGVKVAVIDTGLDTTHPMFSNRLAPTAEWKDYVDGDTTPAEVAGGSAYGHGTATAGIILQVVPKATILPIRVLDQNGLGDVANVVSAIDWAMQKGAQVINLSLGTNVDVPALKTQIDYATSQGVYVIASAGNEGSTTTLTYPAQYATTGTNEKYLISVGSIKSDNNTSSFSNTGTALEILTPGEGVYSAYPGNQTVKATGTSFAAPAVAGAVALGYMDTALANQGNLESYMTNSGNSNSQARKVLSVVGMLRQAPDFTSKQALLVVVGATLNTFEATLHDSLQGLGYAVTVVDDDTAAASHANGKNIMVFSPSADDKKVSTKFSGVAIPAVVMGEKMFAEMKMTGSTTSDRGSSAGETQVMTLNAAHPLAAGLSASPSVLSSSTSIGWGNPATAAVRVGSLVSSSNKSTVFGYDSGAQMVGLAAPARRVGLFPRSADSSLSESGKRLLEAAITWALSGN